MGVFWRAHRRCFREKRGSDDDECLWQSQHVTVENPATWRSLVTMAKAAGGQRGQEGRT